MLLRNWATRAAPSMGIQHGPLAEDLPAGAQVLLAEQAQPREGLGHDLHALIGGRSDGDLVAIAVVADVGHLAQRCQMVKVRPGNQWKPAAMQFNVMP